MPMAETDVTETFVKYEWKHGLSMENCNHPPQISFRIAKYRSIYAASLTPSTIFANKWTDLNLNHPEELVLKFQSKQNK